MNKEERFELLDKVYNRISDYALDIDTDVKNWGIEVLQESGDVVPPFSEITKEELKRVLKLYKLGIIDLKDYWKPGDKRVTEDGEYVILDIERDLDGRYNNHCIQHTRTVTIMRTDFVNYHARLGSKEDADSLEFFNTELFYDLACNRKFFAGKLFKDFISHRVLKGYSIECSVFIPSAKEVFNEEKAYEFF